MRAAGLLAAYRSLLDAAADMVFVRDLSEGRLLEVNEALCRRFGYSREELLGRPVFDLYYTPSDRPRGLAFSKAVREGGAAFLHVVFRTRDGRPLEAELRGSRLRYGERDAALVIARDISEEARQRRLSLVLAAGFRQSNDVMFYTDRHGVILDVNDAFARHYGWTRDEVVGQTPRILRSRYTTNDMYRRMWTSISDPKKGYWRGELINKAKEGRELPVLLTITAVKDEHGESVGYISNAIDLSEQKDLHARLAQSESLASLGQMASVVAHEIRNPLGSIVMAARQLVSGSLSEDDRELVLSAVRSEADRLSQTLTNFLSFARPRDLKLRPADLNALVSDIARAVRSNPELLRGARLELELDKRLPPFPMDPDQIRQVAWNLVVNAVQAVDGKGQVRVSTRAEPGFAALRVEDDGPGITPADLESIFKPFFTTKRQGSGLGLAIADKIAAAHGGRIEARSEPGRGATFKLLLPLAEA